MTPQSRVRRSYAVAPQSLSGEAGSQPAAALALPCTLIDSAACAGRIGADGWGIVNEASKSILFIAQVGGRGDEQAGMSVEYASPQITLIAALDCNYAIGRDRTMPWHLPGDLQRFKRLTLGKPVLMGRRTALAIGGLLPGRRNLVLTHSGSAPFAGQEVVASLDVAIAAASESDELCVIGGGEVYALALPYATRMHLTLVGAEVKGADAFFPAFDQAAWREIAREHHAADARHKYTYDFVDYEKA